MNRRPLGLKLSQAVDGFQEKTAAGLSPNTLRSYEHLLRIWSSHRGLVELDRVITQDVREFLALLLLRPRPHMLIFPGAVLTATVLFYIVLLISGGSVEQAGAQGWLLGPFPTNGMGQVLGSIALDRIDWRLMAGQLDKMGLVLVVSMVALLLNSSGLEIGVKQDLDWTRELVSAGLANLIGGLGGSATGYQTLTLSVLASRMGAGRRLAGLTAAAVCAAALLAGISLVALFPRPVVGALLLFLGLAFLLEWVYEPRLKLTRLDHILVLAIIATVATVGFLQACWSALASP